MQSIHSQSLYMCIFIICYMDDMFRPLYFRPSSGPTVVLLHAMPVVIGESNLKISLSQLALHGAKQPMDLKMAQNREAETCRPCNI